MIHLELYGFNISFRWFKVLFLSSSVFVSTKYVFESRFACIMVKAVDLRREAENNSCLRNVSLVLRSRF